MNAVNTVNAVSATNATNATNATVQSCTNAESLLKLETAPALPYEVYSNLPDMLKTRASLIDKDYQKDVFLIAALPVIAAHMPNVLAAHRDGYYTPDLFTQIIAEPGTGKGIASKAKALGNVLQNNFLDKYEKAKREFSMMPEKEKATANIPTLKSLFIPANSSSRAIYDRLEANKGSGLLFENEVDTLLGATSQEWGNFSDICRKAFHHEAISINRKGEIFYIDNPRLSICLTGTFDQFKNMFESAENGHFSRYALYTFDVPHEWQTHRPTKNSRNLVESVKTASQELFELYERLNKRDEPLYIDLKDEQWQQIDNTFSNNMRIIEDLGLSKHLHASNNRSAVLALRIASMLTVLRTNEHNKYKIAADEYLTPSPADMNAALLLAQNFIEHAIRLYYLLPNSESTTDARGERYKTWLAKLPEEFETEDALIAGEHFDVPERTVKDWLSKTQNIKRLKRGHYKKVQDL